MKLKLPFRLSWRVLRILDRQAIFDNWWVLPFNGQAIRARLTYRIALSFKPTAIIETGTYFGTTSIFLSKLSNNVHTIEIDPEIAKIADTRFKKSGTNVKLHLGSSAEVLEEILRDLNPNTDRVLCYLDAHWGSHLPLNQELIALCNWGGSFISIIDDFQNPYDPDYGFDSYGSTNVGTELVPKDRNLVLMVPKEPSKFETGAKRGTGYVFSQAVIEKLESEVFENLEFVQLQLLN